MEAGMEAGQWYSLGIKKDAGPTVDIYEIHLNVPLFNQLLKTHAMTSAFRNKSSIIQLPDTPFRLKLAFLGRKNELMEIYFTSMYTVFFKSELNLTMGNYSQTFLTKGYGRLDANKWWYAFGLKDPGLRAEANYDTLCLYFKFKINLKPEPIEMPTPQLSDDFQILLADGIYSDVIMKSNEGVEFNVHKNILCIRSYVLKAHFEHDLKESRTNTVQTHFETEVLRDVLIFLYTDTAPRVSNEPGKLLAAADFYQIQGLKRICEKSLFKKLTIENAIETLQLAELHDTKNLKLQTLEFIKNEGPLAITETEGWKNNTSAELIKMIYKYMMNDVSTDVLTVAYSQL